MIKSMTGFASLTRETENATLSVTVRSVNHRYFDLQPRLPSSLAGHETRLRGIVQKRIARGRVEVSVSLQLRRPTGVEVELNEPFVEALSAVLEQARDRGLIAGTLQPGDLLRIPQALTIRERQADVDEAAAPDTQRAVDAALDEALVELDAMRTHEGAYLRADLDARRAVLADLLDRIGINAHEGSAALQVRLARRVDEMAKEMGGDPAAIAQEIVRFAARSDINEEMVRFRGHLSHWNALAESPEPCGRKLDFLLQEMHREINTIGSKAEGTAVAELIVAGKAELEKMREQVQNVE